MSRLFSRTVHGRHRRHRNGNRVIPCGCELDAEGNIIPQRGCEIHWHQVTDGPVPPVEHS